MVRIHGSVVDYVMKSCPPSPTLRKKLAALREQKEMRKQKKALRRILKEGN